MKPCRWLEFGGVEVGKAFREVCNCSVGVRKAAVEPVMPSVEVGMRAVGLISITVNRERASVKFATAPLRLGNGALKFETVALG